MTHRAVLCSAALLLAAATAAAQAPRPGEIRVVDDAGRAVTLARPAGRIVSTLPSVTELILALDGGDRLVARTDFDADPRVAALPSVGGTARPNLESLVGAAPDLVILGPGPEAGRAYRLLRSIGVPAYTADVNSIDDIRRTIRHLGALLGVPAQRLSDRIDAELAAVAATAPDAGPTVMYVLWHDPPRTAGAGTYIDELIELAGGRNAFGGVVTPWPQVGLEEVVRRDPHILVVPAGPHGPDRSWLERTRGWRDLSAVRAGRIVSVDPDLFHRPGPRVAEAARALARELRPFLEEVR